MYVVQLAAEGLSGFPARARLGFRGHLDVVSLSSEVERSVLLDVLFHTLFPSVDHPDATAALADRTTPQQRSVVTVSGRDRTPYRLLRDLVTGRTRLYRFDRQAGSHVPMSDSSAEALQFLRVQFHLPDPAAYERLFIFASDARPSLGPRAKSRSGASVFPGSYGVRPSGPGLGSGSFPPSASASGLGAPAGSSSSLGAASLATDLSQPRLTAVFPLPSVLGEATGIHQVPSGFSMHNVLVQQELEGSGTLDLTPDSTDRDLVARYEELRTQKRDHALAREAERRLDALDERARQAERAIEARRAVAEQLSRLETRLQGYQPLAQAPGAARDRIERYLASETRHRAERAKLIREMDEQKDRVPPAHPSPVREPMLVGGTFGVGAALVSAFLFDLPALALVQAAAGALAGAGALRFLAQSETATLAQSRGKELQERLAKMDRQHQLESGSVRSLVAELGLEDAAEVAERLDDVEVWVAERDDLLRELEGEVGRRADRAREVLAKIAEHRQKYQKLVSASSASSLEGIERRLAGLRKEMRYRGLTPPDVQVRDPASPDDDEDAGPTRGRSGGGSGGYSLSPSGYDCAASGSWGGGGGVGSYSGGGSGKEERVRVLVETAADLVGKSFEDFSEEVTPRIQRYLAGLTGGDFNRARLGGFPQLMVAGTGGEVAYADLDGAELDRVDAALRFALVESVVRVRKTPILVEEPVAALPPSRRNMMKRIYAHLAKLTQVILLTPSGDIEGNQVEIR